MALGQRLVVEPELGERARAHVLHQDVRLRHELERPRRSISEVRSSSIDRLPRFRVRKLALSPSLKTGPWRR